MVERLLFSLSTILWTGTFIYGQEVASANLILYIPGESETNTDQSGRNHQLIYHDVSFGDGKQGAALTFDGTNSYLEVPFSGGLAIPNQLTTSFWYKHESQETFGFYSLIEQSADEFGGHSRYGTWIFERDKLQTCIEPDQCPEGANVCQRCISSLEQLVEGSWYYISSTYSGDNLKLYINGLLSAERTFDQSTGISVRNYALTLGTDVFDPDPLFLKGTLDEVRVYNKALTETEIFQLFEGLELEEPLKVTGLESKMLKGAVAYPNPASTQTWLNKEKQISKVSIINHSGQLIRTLFADAHNRIDLSGVNDGVYIIQYSSGGSLHSSRLIIEK